MTFTGFPEESTSPTRIPDQFFRQVLPTINKLDELKLTLYVFWRLERLEGVFRYLSLTDLLKDTQLVILMGKTSEKAPAAIESALHRAVRRGTLLQVEVEDGQDTLIWLNSPKGRAAVEAIKRGDWHPVPGMAPPDVLFTGRPNIFQLYEANIGPLTPLIADALRDAESIYQASWVEEAFRIAVERNKRNWHYIEAILHRWQEGGRDDRKDRQDRFNPEKAGRRYSDWEK